MCGQCIARDVGRAEPGGAVGLSWAVGRQNLARAEIGDAEGVLELFWLLVTTVLGSIRPRHELVLENLLLRLQVAVLTRPLEADGGLGCVPGTSCSGWWHAASPPAGAST